jgi:ABC-type dipeptide/oligopeptide/nickel transport system permease component
LKLSYLLKRLLSAIPVLFIVSLLSFFFIHMIPGNPAIALLGPNATPNEIESLKLEMGLDKPLPLQYAAWLGKMLTGDMGNSILSGRPIFDSITQRLPHTLVLAFLSILFSISIAIPIGIIAAVKQNTIIDRVVMFLALVGVSVPSFWLGILGIIVFAVTLQWIPAAGYVSVFEDFLTGLRYMAMPSISLGLVLAAVSTRMTRASMLETLRQDYIRTARAKGLGKWAAILKHGVKNALIPVITVIGVDFGWLLGGTVVIETVFGIPGMGRLVVYGIMNRDYPVIQGVILYMAVIYMLVNLIVDIMVIFLNPRIKT